MTSIINSDKEPLDRERLRQLYGDDTEMQASSLEMFLDEVLPIFLELKNHVECADWEQVITVTHQLRPWLIMVGLTTLESKLCEVEKMAKETPELTLLCSEYGFFYNQLEDKIPVLKMELQRLY